MSFIPSRSPVEHCRASNGEGHHDNEVGEEGKGAEDEVGLWSKAGLDDLQKQEDFSYSLWTWRPQQVKCIFALFVGIQPIIWMRKMQKCLSSLFFFNVSIDCTRKQCMINLPICVMWIFATNRLSGWLQAIVINLLHLSVNMIQDRFVWIVWWRTWKMTTKTLHPIILNSDKFMV